MNNIYYKITVVDDFKNKESVIDCKQFGTLLVVDAYTISSKHKGYQVDSDSIRVYLNRDNVIETKDRSRVIGIVRKLIAEAPREFKKEFEQFSEYITDLEK